MNLDKLITGTLDHLQQLAAEEGVKLAGKLIDDATDWLRERLTQDPGVVNAGRLEVEEVPDLDDI